MDNRELTLKRIREIRKSLGLTVEQAAVKVGVRPRTWRSWEQPSQNRSPSDAPAILIRLLEKRKI